MHANLMAILKKEMFILKVNRRDEPGGVSVTSDQLYSPNFMTRGDRRAMDEVAVIYFYLSLPCTQFFTLRLLKESSSSVRS